MDFAPFEKALLAWTANHSRDEAPKKQLAVVTAVDREITGVGFYTSLRVPPGMKKSFAPSGMADGTPHFFCPGVGLGAITVIWLKEAIIDLLEVVTCGGDLLDAVPTKWAFFTWGDHMPETFEKLGV